MKKNVLILSSLILVLLVSSCSSQSGDLPIATYKEQQNSTYKQQIAFKDKHFIKVGTATDPDKKMKDKRIGCLENQVSKSKLYIHSIAGYDENNFVFVEELESNMLNTGYYKILSFYVSFDVDNIPLKFISTMPSGIEISFENKEYHYYSKTHPNFRFGDKLGETNDKLGTAVTIYNVLGRADNGWIAVKENENDDIVRLFWSDLTESLPMEYLEFPQKYPDVDYLQKHMN